LPLALHLRTHVRANPAFAGPATPWSVFPLPVSALGLSRRTPPPTRGIGKFQTAGKGRVFARRLYAIIFIVAPAATPPPGAAPSPAGRPSGKRLGIRASPCSGIVPSHPHRRFVRHLPTLPFEIFFLTPGRAFFVLPVLYCGPLRQPPNF